MSNKSNSSKQKMTNYFKLFSILVSLIVLLAILVPLQSESHFLKRKQIRALKKVAIAATVLGNRKKVMIPLPVPLPLPFPIIHKHEPIISPIDPLLTIVQAKGAKGYYGGFTGGFTGIGGGIGNGKRR